MWLYESDGFTEIFKGYLPYYFLVALPIFLMISPINTVAANNEFTAFRMQQYDLHTVPHGCRSSVVNLEGRALTNWATMRHCVVAHILKITVGQLEEIRNKAGALLLVMPKNETMLSLEEQEHIQYIEMAIAQQEFTKPVYFVPWCSDLDGILGELHGSFITDDKSATALEALTNSVAANGYQIVITAPAPLKLDSKAVTIHGRLLGTSDSGQTIVVTAHYESSGVAPGLSFGADSNASGAVALLELARIFSRLYSSVSTRGGPTLVFALTSSGPTLNYFSTKKWIEDQLSVTDNVLQDIQFVMCLDSISSKPSMNMHVSKPPKAGLPTHSIKSRLGVPIVHKKINLADELLAWQHERYSIRRITAFTLSSLETHKDPSRGSILDKYSEKSLLNLITNIETTARALASHVYNITSEDSIEDRQLFEEALEVDQDSIRHWFKYLSTQSRSPNYVSVSNGNNAAGLASSLERALSKYINEVQTTIHTVDKREPEFTLYGPTQATINVYNVKPAIFDLMLSVAIAAYLGVLYLAMQGFPLFYTKLSQLVNGKGKVQ